MKSRTEYDHRYAFVTCSQCGYQWQRIYYGCAAHQITCGYPLPPQVEPQPTTGLTSEQWREFDKAHLHPPTDLHRAGCVSCQYAYDSKLPNHGEQGSALTPVIAILTAFTVALVLIAQSGILHTICARLAEVR